ncbi:MAG: tRNA (adenosine(37)-N6)-dimethylallyltransferase MiaA [Nitrospira sp.]|nr:tRNA (adenosine(37)-N6)-dimethylallyltransferase MiaA [Nitrospira sp.]
MKGQGLGVRGQGAGKKTVIILLGPTGVGKTACSLMLAQALDTEIISADSMLVYRGMNIGTAKPSTEELNAVPHHLIDILEPDQLFSAGIFREKASAIISDLHGRGRVPLVVGGTGLYIRSLTQGLFDGPSADWEMREALLKEEQVQGRGYLHERLIKLDPVSAVSMDPGDTKKVVRALEVLMQQGERLSESTQASTFPLECEFIKIGLTRERSELYPRIEQRVQKMVEEGLEEEVRSLLARNPGRTALQAIGYKEMISFINGLESFDETLRIIKKRSKMYAKRQFTWFKKEPDIYWVDITGIDDAQMIFEKVLNDVRMLDNYGLA